MKKVKKIPKTKTILFATTNKRKVGEAQLACEPFGIKVEQVELAIDEIQSHIPINIAKRKAQDAYLQIKKPVVVTDTFWNIPVLNGFPGGYMKEVMNWFTSEDFITLLKNKKDKRAAFTESVVYKDTSKLKVFSKKFWGRIVSKPRGTGNSIENIAEFDGFTLGERRTQGRYSHQTEDYVWIDFAKWFSKL